MREVDPEVFKAVVTTRAYRVAFGRESRDGHGQARDYDIRHFVDNAVRVLRQFDEGPWRLADTSSSTRIRRVEDFADSIGHKGESVDVSKQVADVT